MDTENQYGVLQLQKKLLGLLKVFHSFCEENNIKYSLDWGTLLGAVRHKGFIPWDDDLDIMIDRVNYAKLLRCIRDSQDLAYDEDSDRSYWIGRVRFAEDDGTDIYPPTIDVIIMDNAPNGRFSRQFRLLLIKALQGSLKYKPRFDRGGFLMRMSSRITYYMGLPFSHATKMKWYHIISQLSNKTGTREITSYYEEYSCLGRYYPNTLMDEMVLLPFENIQAYVVKDYHRCLIIQFGADYMTPIKDRLNHTEKRIYLTHKND